MTSVLFKIYKNDAIRPLNAQLTLKPYGVDTLLSSLRATDTVSRKILEVLVRSAKILHRIYYIYFIRGNALDRNHIRLSLQKVAMLDDYQI